MSNLVNPYGWRVPQIKSWDTTYYLKDEKAYPFSVHSFNCIYAVAHSILSFLNTVNYSYNFVSFSSFTVLVNKKQVTVLVRLKVYWYNLFKALAVQQNRNTNYLSEQQTFLPYFINSKFAKQALSRISPGHTQVSKRKSTRQKLINRFGIKKPSYKKKGGYLASKRKKNIFTRIGRRSKRFPRVWLKYTKRRTWWHLSRLRRVGVKATAYVVYLQKLKGLSKKRARAKKLKQLRKLAKLSKTLYTLYKHPLKRLSRAYFLYRSKTTPELTPNYFDLVNNKLTARFTRAYFAFFLINPILQHVKSLIATAINLKFQTNLRCKTYFIGLSEGSLNVRDILLYLKYMLSKKRYSPMKSLYAALKVLTVFKRRLGWRGYKLLLAGRFTRRGRATYLWRSSSGVNVGTKLSRIDHFVLPLQLRYSKSIVKLWVAYDKEKKKFLKYPRRTQVGRNM